MKNEVVVGTQALPGSRAEDRPFEIQTAVDRLPNSEPLQAIKVADHLRRG